MNRKEKIKTDGADLIEALSPLVKWHYDDFHKAMLAQFSVDKEARVRRALHSVLPVSWNAKTIKKAPEEIKHFAGFFYTLFKNQQLLSLALENNPKVMVAWWPWRDGATISIRIFLVNSSPYVEKKGFFSKLKHIFD